MNKIQFRRIIPYLSNFHIILKSFFKEYGDWIYFVLGIAVSLIITGISTPYFSIYLSCAVAIFLTVVVLFIYYSIKKFIPMNKKDTSYYMLYSNPPKTYTFKTPSLMLDAQFSTELSFKVELNEIVMNYFKYHNINCYTLVVEKDKSINVNMSPEYLENIYPQNEVNGFNLNNNTTILLDSCIDLIKNYPMNRQKQYQMDKSNTDMNGFKQDLKIHLEYIYSFIDLIYNIKFFNDEFHKGCSIKNIAEYILNDTQLFRKHSNFLLDLIDKFIELCRYKAINISKLTDSKIKKEYNKLSVDFRKLEQYFYTTIYQQSTYDKEFLDDMSNLLSRKT